MINFIYSIISFIITFTFTLKLRVIRALTLFFTLTLIFKVYIVILSKCLLVYLRF